MVPAMEFPRILLCITVFAAAGCASTAGTAPDALKTRLLEREGRSLHQQATARIQALQWENATGILEVPLPEPNLALPVSELVPWTD